MVFAQQIFVLFNYWWKYVGLGLAKNIERPEAGVSLTSSRASLRKAVVLTEA